MPLPQTTLVRSTTSSTINVASDPVVMLLHSLMTIGKADYLSGYDSWIKEAAAALSPEQLDLNQLVMIGLHYAAMPVKRWDSFPAYLTHLQAQDPTILRDRILTTYEKTIHFKHPDQPAPDWDKLLNNRQEYLDFLSEAFSKEYIDIEVESKAFDLLNDPPAMRNLIVSHLQSMWDDLLQPEWDRISPTIQACVEAHQEISLTGLTPLAAADKIIGPELSLKCEWALKDENLQEVVFVPSTHVGPYVGTIKSDDVVWIIFGVRLPEGSKFKSSALSRAELLVRLDALADDTRLQILSLIIENGEMCSKDIIQALNLSQSAVSRHLKQLSATGYVIERRRESAKCYKLNQDRVDNTIDALKHYLSDS